MPHTWICKWVRCVAVLQSYPTIVLPAWSLDEGEIGPKSGPFRFFMRLLINLLCRSSIDHAAHPLCLSIPDTLSWLPWHPTTLQLPRTLLSTANGALFEKLMYKMRPQHELFPVGLFIKNYLLFSLLRLTHSHLCC